MAVWDWSTTAGSNQTADANINWQEGQLPSTVNNSARGMMAALRAFVQDQGGYATLGGSGNAFALALSQTMATRAPGLIGFFATRTNTGAVTLQVDSTTAAPLRAVSGTDLASGLSCRTFRALPQSLPPTRWPISSPSSPTIPSRSR